MKCFFRLLILLILLGDYNHEGCGNCCKKFIIKTEEEFKKELLKKLSEINKVDDSLINDIGNNNKDNFVNPNALNNIDFSEDDYWDMYCEMTEDIFTSDAALELMAYRKLLREVGITNALKEIFAPNSNQITWYPSIGQPNGDDRYVGFNLGITQKPNEAEISLKEINSQKTEYFFGGFYINNEHFKWLRCKGGENPNENDGACTDQDKCVSCLLYKLLLRFNLCSKDTCREKKASSENKDNNPFLFLFDKQALGSDFSNEIKKIILSLTKFQWFWKYNTRLDLNEIKNTDVNKQTKQCFMIEWALTVELLKLLSPIIYKNNNNKNTILYRTISTKQLQEEYKNRRDIFESTSLFGPVYAKGQVYVLATYSYIKFPKVPIYRCIFNYIISPCKYTIFDENTGDPEQEIGCITTDLDFEELFTSEEDMQFFDKKWKDKKDKNNGAEYLKSLQKNDEGKKSFWLRQDFLIRKFMDQLKINLEKNKSPEIKKVIFPEHLSFYDGHRDKKETSKFWLYNLEETRDII